MQSPPFNQQLLRSCVQSPNNFPNKYPVFTQQFQQSNQEWIHKSIRIFKSILTDNQSSPVKKMQTLNAIKEGLDTCEYGFITLVQVQILPIFMDIARYRKEDFDDNRGRSLFLANLRNPRQRQEAEQIGNNYLRIILECIQVWAKVKPYHIIEEYIELQDLDSEWMRALRELKADSVTFPHQLIFFSPQDIEKLKQGFAEKAEGTGEGRERYVQYYRIILYDGLEQERNYHNESTQHLIKLYKYGDGLLLNDGLKYIEYNLTEENVSPMKKILSLKMLNQLFKSGQFNIIEFTNQLSPRLVDSVYYLDTNETSLRRGEFLFKGEGGKRYGGVYYSQLLKSLQLWAACVPYDTLGRNSPSQFAAGIQRLKQQKRLEFPKISSSEFSLFKQQFNRNEKRNQVKNEMLKELQHDIELQTPGSLKTTSIASKNPHQPQSSLIARNRKLSSQLSPNLPNFDSQSPNQRYQTLKHIYSQMDHILPSNQVQNRQWLANSMSYIQKYCQVNPSLIANLGDNSRIIDDLDKAEKILGIYERYNDKKMSYGEFLNTVKGIHRGSYMSMVQSSEMMEQQLKYENQLQQKQKQQLQKVIMKSREEIIPINVNSLNTVPHDSHDMTVNRTAHFLPSIPSGTNLGVNQGRMGVEQYGMSGQGFVHQEQVFIPNPMPFTTGNARNQQMPQQIQPVQPVQQTQQQNIIQPIMQTTQITQTVTYSPLSPSHFPPLSQSPYQSNSPNSLQAPINEYGFRQSQEQLSSRQNMSLNKKQQRSESFSDALRSKQKIVIEGFQHNLLDSKLSLLNKQESERKIQSSMSLKNIINKSNSINNISPTANPISPRALSPAPNIPRHPSYQQQSPLPNLQRQIFPKPQTREFSKESTPIQSIMNQENNNYYSIKEQDSKIIQPYLQPLNNSYYQSYDMKIQSNNNLDFKHAFDSNKYYIGDNSAHIKDKIWMEKQAILLRSNHENVGSVNVPQALNQLQLHHSGQVVNLEQHYQKIIQSLQNKISSLEYQLLESKKSNFNLERQLDSMRGSMTYSRPITDRTPRDSSLKVSRWNSPGKRILKEPIGRKIHEQPYRISLSVIKDTSIKKTMLKNKDLLLKNSSIQIGFMISSDQKLRITLYILSFWNLLNFNAKLNNPGNLVISMSSPNLTANLEAQKQYKLILQIQTPFMNLLPLQIPSLNISFQQSNTRSPHNYQLLLPCSINRFFEYLYPIQDIPAFNAQFQNTNPNLVLRTQQQLLNTKIIKEPNMIVSLLPKLKLVSAGDSLEQGMDMMFGGEASYGNLRLLVRCVVRPNGSMYWQARDQSGQCPEMIIGEYLATMSWLTSH